MAKMNKATVSRKTNLIFNKTVLYMQEIGTYKKEFDVTIRRYAEMRFQYDLLYAKWFEEGCKVTETFRINPEMRIFVRLQNIWPSKLFKRIFSQSKQL